jgi:hypothetical protein
MTILVQETQLQQEFTLNLTNLQLGAYYSFILTSQYSHQPLVIAATATVTNARYTTFSVTFPTGFGDEHKNGIYNWELKTATTTLEEGLVKIITEPGGGLGTTNFESGINKENRIADVFYRPNY